MQGGFSVQIGSHNPFGRIPVDQTIEETINKDTQTPGGTKVFSLKPGAVARYYMTSEYRSTFLRQLRSMVHVGQHDYFSHPDIRFPRIRKDEADIQSLIQLLDSSWLNPFNSDQDELVSISTATVAPAEVAIDLLESHKIGEEAYQAFKEKRLNTAVPSTKFHDKMSKLKLKTLSDITKKSRSRKNTNDVVLKAARKLFCQIILVAENGKLHMSDVLSHPLGPLPWALANGDGSLRRTNKAVLAKELEETVSPA